MKSQAAVFVVDPDGPTRDAVCNLVALMNLRCRPYALGHEFLEAYSSAQAACLVSEVRIPDLNGFEIQKRLAARGSVTPIIFLTAQATVSIAVRAMRAGAFHFLEKPFREHELWDTIQEAILLDEQRRCVSTERRKLQSRLARLTPEERELLEMIAQGKPKKAIASQMDVCVRTIELRRSQLIKKLGVGSLMELVHFALVPCDGTLHRALETHHV
jgi:FixJ family two-component response regulator